MPAQVTPVGSTTSITGIGLAGRAGHRPAVAAREVRIAVPYSTGNAARRLCARRGSRSGTTTAPLLPQSAVLSDEKGNYVYIVNAKNEVERRPIKIGTVDEQRRHDRRRAVGQ